METFLSNFKRKLISFTIQGRVVQNYVVLYLKLDSQHGCPTSARLVCVENINSEPYFNDRKVTQGQELKWSFKNKTQWLTGGENGSKVIMEEMCLAFKGRKWNVVQRIKDESYIIKIRCSLEITCRRSLRIQRKPPFILAFVGMYPKE